jgi:hypothetical protein
VLEVVPIPEGLGQRALARCDPLGLGFCRSVHHVGTKNEVQRARTLSTRDGADYVVFGPQWEDRLEGWLEDRWLSLVGPRGASAISRRRVRDRRSRRSSLLSATAPTLVS